MKKSLLIAFSTFVYSITYSQNVNEQMSSVIWKLGPGNPRLNIEFGTKGINIGGYEETAPIVTNNFPDELFVTIQFELIDNCSQSKFYTISEKLGNREVYAPNPFMAGYSFQSTCAKITEYGSVKKVKTRISRINFSIIELRNLTEETKQKEVEALKRKEESRKRNDQQQTTPAKSGITNSSSQIQNNTILSPSQNTKSKSSEEYVSQNEETTRQTSVQQEKIKADEERARAAEEEQKKAMERQQEYDNWKSNAQRERDNADVASVAASVTVLTLLGGFIYDGMGNVDPDFTYESPLPENKLKPVFYMNNAFGYSAIITPILFQSNRSTLQNGQSINKKEYIDGTGFYLNLGGESKMGINTDYYQAYGLIGMKFGFIPTFNGILFNMYGGGGAAIGIKNVKVFGDYRSYFFDSKSVSSSDVEENGSGDYGMSSSEFSYGLKFTFGGTAKDNYVRQHVLIGAVTKGFDFTKDTFDGFYDPNSKSINTVGNPTVKGFSFEWRKDHFFSLYFKYFEDFIYVGDVNRFSNFPAKLDSPTGSYVEIGFLRTLDLY
jgi:hypothetical protein